MAIHDHSGGEQATERRSKSMPDLSVDRPFPLTERDDDQTDEVSWRPKPVSLSPDFARPERGIF